MSQDIMEILKDAALRTFQTMLMVELVPSDIDMNEPEWNVLGLIGYSGDMNGNIALCMTESGATEAVLRFSGQPSEGTDDITDCVGELVNMIGGNAKSTFSDKQVSLSLPEVIRGKCISLDFKRFREKKCITFSSEIGPVKIIFAGK